MLCRVERTMVLAIRGADERWPRCDGSLTTNVSSSARHRSRSCKSTTQWVIITHRVVDLHDRERCLALLETFVVNEPSQRGHLSSAPRIASTMVRSTRHSMWEATDDGRRRPAPSHLRHDLARHGLLLQLRRDAQAAHAGALHPRGRHHLAQTRHDEVEVEVRAEPGRGEDEM